MKHVIAIDLGGTSVKYALVNEAGEILFHGKLPSNAHISAEAVIEQLKCAVRAVLAAATQQGVTPLAIGLGSPGITDAQGEVLLGGAENIQGWSNIPLAQILHDEFQLPTRIDNDANLMGLGEQAFGAARGCSDILFLTIGTGIGGAVVIGGNLFRGFDSRGTELGHIPFISNGETCACGAVGCWEHYASTSALVREYSAHYAGDAASVDGVHIVAQYQAGDALATRCIEQHCRYVAQGIAGLVNIFSPQRVIIGGGISEAGNFYLELIDSNYKQLVLEPCGANTQLALASLGNRAGLMGAAQLALTLTTS